MMPTSPVASLGGATFTNLHTGMPSPPSAVGPAAAAAAPATAPQMLFAAQTVVSQYHPFPVQQPSSQLMTHDSRVCAHS